MLLLVAEDNPDNRNLLTRRLERQGWDVIAADDGLEAVEMCHSARPDLVLMDIAMPRMTGIEATRACVRIRAPPQSRSSPSPRTRWRPIGSNASPPAATTLPPNRSTFLGCLP